jgi:hypothetical protein
MTASKSCCTVVIDKKIWFAVVLMVSMCNRYDSSTDRKQKEMRKEGVVCLGCDCAYLSSMVEYCVNHGLIGIRVHAHLEKKTRSSQRTRE